MKSNPPTGLSYYFLSSSIFKKIINDFKFNNNGKLKFMPLIIII